MAHVTVEVHSCGTTKEWGWPVCHRFGVRPYRQEVLLGC